MATETKVKWTPGPWKAHGGSYCPIVATVNGKSAQIGRAETCGQIPDEEVEANARLISKAPEMYEMLLKVSEGHAEIGEIRALLKETAIRSYDSEGGEDQA